MGETTSAAVERTRNLSCGSDSGSATAIRTVSITNFCSRVSLAGLAGAAGLRFCRSLKAWIALLLGRPSQRKTKDDHSSQKLLYVLHCS